jgi:hypothetical protein
VKCVFKSINVKSNLEDGLSNFKNRSYGKWFNYICELGEAEVNVENLIFNQMKRYDSMCIYL